MGIVEGTLQTREVAAEHITQPVDHPHPISDQIAAVSHQQPQLGHQRRRDLDLTQIAPVPHGLGNDIGVAGVGLGLTTVGGGHLVGGSAGHVLHRLTVRCQQRQQQPGHGPGDIDCPDHQLGPSENGTDRLQDRALIVDHLRRPHGGARLVDQAHPVVTLPDIDTRPTAGPRLLHQ